MTFFRRDGLLSGNWNKGMEVSRNFTSSGRSRYVVELPKKRDEVTPNSDGSREFPRSNDIFER